MLIIMNNNATVSIHQSDNFWDLGRPIYGQPPNQCAVNRNSRANEAFYHRHKKKDLPAALCVLLNPEPCQGLANKCLMFDGWLTDVDSTLPKR